MDLNFSQSTIDHDLFKVVANLIGNRRLQSTNTLRKQTPFRRTRANQLIQAIQPSILNSQYHDPSTLTVLNSCIFCGGFSSMLRQSASIPCRFPFESDLAAPSNALLGKRVKPTRGRYQCKTSRPKQVSTDWLAIDHRLERCFLTKQGQDVLWILVGQRQHIRAGLDQDLGSSQLCRFFCEVGVAD